jgi:hypothetical protein
MNFFGHAVVACQYETTPRFVLGAMLPDFASMIRARMGPVHDGPLARGVALHHRTDQAFHTAATFVELCDQAHCELESRGVGRGPARAVAHIGTELLLDGEMLSDPAARHRYVEALGEMPRIELQWRSAEGPARLERLHARLTAWGIPDDLAVPQQVLERLQRALQGRPRLQLQPRDRRILEAWMPHWQQHVRRHRTRLWSELWESLPRVHGGAAGD